METKFFRNIIFSLFLLIYSFDEVQSYNCIPHDSIECSDKIARHYFRIGGSIAPGFFTFSKLGIRSPSYQKPNVIQEGTNSDLGWNLEFGLAYRKTNALFSIEPVGKSIGSTSKDEYDISDSLSLSDQYHLIYRRVEFSQSWYYNKSSKNSFFGEIAPLLGYGWFMRKYNGEVQDLKIKEKVFDFRDHSLSEGLVLGGRIHLAYSLRKKQQRSKAGDFMYDDNGLFISFSYRSFDDIQQLTFETGWILLESVNASELSRFMVFLRFNEMNGALQGRAYNIGIRSSLSIKELFNN